MTLTISLREDAEAALKKRERAAGQDVARFVEQLIDRELAASETLVTAAEPLARAFEASSMSEEQLLSLLAEERDGERRDRGERRE